MNKIAIKKMFSIVRIILIASCILLLFSLNYHFKLNSGIGFNDSLRPEKTMKYKDKEDQKKYVDSYMCFSPESMIDVMVISKEMTKSKRDALIELNVKDGASSTNISGFPAYRVKGNGSTVFGGGTYYIPTNDLVYIICFHSNIGQEKEMEILKGVTISGGDYGFRYYVGKGFFIILAVFSITLILFIILVILKKRETDCMLATQKKEQRNYSEDLY